MSCRRVFKNLSNQRIAKFIIYYLLFKLVTQWKKLSNGNLQWHLVLGFSYSSYKFTHTYQFENLIIAYIDLLVPFNSIIHINTYISVICNDTSNQTFGRIILQMFFCFLSLISTLHICFSLLSCNIVDSYLCHEGKTKKISHMKFTSNTKNKNNNNCKTKNVSFGEATKCTWHEGN